MRDTSCCVQCGKLKIPNPDEADEIDCNSEEKSKEIEGLNSPPHIVVTNKNLVIPPDHENMNYGYVQSTQLGNLIWFRYCKEADDSFIIGASLKKDRLGPIYFHDLDYLQLDDGKIPDDMFGYFGKLCLSSMFSREFILTIPINGLYVETTCISFISLGKPDLLLLRAMTRVNPLSDDAKTCSIRSRMAKRGRKSYSKDSYLFQQFKNSKLHYEYSSLGQKEETDELVIFESQKPAWSDQTRSFTLDFNGRCLEKSPKNFILIPALDDHSGFGETIGVRYGKVSRDKFNLDYRFPFSVMSAFGIALAQELLAAPSCGE